MKDNARISPLAVALRFLGLVYATSWIMSTFIVIEAIRQPSDQEWSAIQGLAAIYAVLPVAFAAIILVGLGIGAGLMASGTWIFTGKAEWPFKKQKGASN